ncbi:putative salutaridinol 7-O-acetyltransferase [Helianthus annuus]|nr:putative salutaridinol 7-O-acetyltransferase [Helianthus annuus]KAJ0522151.1 putative salutaridinol 7-O-acetyltransferase [Helianthus annuus]KAJ0697090.1 putative salutaridinol 7-O-acetyltransferase [Helianthus annuus]
MLVIVQANVFDCGSLVIGVSTSHKVTDAYNLVMFINAWASMNCTECSNAGYCPSFDSLPSVFQPMKVPSLEPPPVTVDQPPVILTKRCVFNETAISNLRAKACPENS